MLDQIRSAIAELLVGIDAVTAGVVGAAIYCVWGSVPQAPSVDRMAEALRGHGVASSVRPAGVFHALLATGAEAAGDLPVFFAAGAAAIESIKQAERGKCRCGGDALDSLIRSAIVEHPAFGPQMLWAEFARRASREYVEANALISYDALDDTIAYEPRPGAEARDIGFAAFRRRVQRVKKMFVGEVRQRPAYVALRPEDASYRQAT